MPLNSYKQKEKKKKVFSHSAGILLLYAIWMILSNVSPLAAPNGQFFSD